MPDETKPADGQSPNPLTQFPTDYSQLTSLYSNFARVTIGPEELILDFGLNTQMTPNVQEPIKVTQRVVMNFFAAKRLMGALVGVVQQLEKAYGPIDENWQKQFRNAGRVQAAKKP